MRHFCKQFKDIIVCKGIIFTTLYLSTLSINAAKFLWHLVFVYKKAAQHFAIPNYKSICIVEMLPFYLSIYYCFRSILLIQKQSWEENTHEMSFLLWILMGSLASYYYGIGKSEMLKYFDIKYWATTFFACVRKSMYIAEWLWRADGYNVCIFLVFLVSLTTFFLPCN